MNFWTNWGPPTHPNQDYDPLLTSAVSNHFIIKIFFTSSPVLRCPQLNFFITRAGRPRVFVSAPDLLLLFFFFFFWGRDCPAHARARFCDWPMDIYISSTDWPDTVACKTEPNSVASAMLQISARWNLSKICARRSRALIGRTQSPVRQSQIASLPLCCKYAWWNLALSGRTHTHAHRGHSTIII
ncbi:hypothetical protein GJAV_G00040480 [Gymnothorax javanicus]|nr:hypothetical protein GJAV_G00040480 [Gymnothorax javanicus]